LYAIKYPRVPAGFCATVFAALDEWITLAAWLRCRKKIMTRLSRTDRIPPYVLLGMKAVTGIIVLMTL
jgi:hypothetical protein